jgi:alpha-galactosidase
LKLVVVGAGSHVFALTVLADALEKHRLDGLELALVDVDAASAETMAGVARRLALDLGVRATANAFTDRRAALPGADFVILCASVQGARRWRMDHDLLAAAGLREQARECGGIGGLAYALRSITLALDVCRDMREICPGATLLDVTNPMPRVVTAVHRHGGVACYGFCNAAHGSAEGYASVARLVGRDPGNLDVVTAGLNHFAWLVSVRDRATGEDLLPLALRNVRAGTFAAGPWDPPAHPRALHLWLERYGAINVVGVNHPAEFLPPDPEVPYEVHVPFHGTPDERRQRTDTLRAVAEGLADWRPLLRANPSWEHPVDVAVALHGRRPLQVDMLNLPNRGTLPQLPADRIVEVPARREGCGMAGAGPLPLPEPTAAICRAVSDVHELVAEGAATGNVAALEEALTRDPAVTETRAARGLLPRLLAAHADILPQFRAALLAVALLAGAGRAAAGFATPPVGGAPEDRVFYVGHGGDVRLACAFALSDGTLLLGGGAKALAWLPAGVTPRTLGGPQPGGGAGTPFLLHVSGDLARVLEVVTLAAGSADYVQSIRATSAPGAPTGEICVSVRTSGGYAILRLDGNFVAHAPAATRWCHAVKASGSIQEDQPWDVGGDGRVVYGTGSPHGYDWVSVERLRPDGQPDVVPQWRRHWYADTSGQMQEFAGTADRCPGKVHHSAIVLKVWGRGDFRSWTKEDFLARSSDGNGGTKQGRWPFDAMFEGYVDPATDKTVPVLENKRGYYGYRWSSTPCANVGAIAVDRRSGAMFIGGNNKSRLPDGQPDFEPWVVAMDHDGALLWWQRLYPESKGVSTPDQYVDALAVDYSVATNRGGALLVIARCHGNNVNNYWRGNEIKHAGNPGHGFQDGFTGTKGNIHYQWIGRLDFAGEMLHATYFAEYGESAKHGNQPFADPLLGHWPRFASGWPDLNTTRVRPLAAVDTNGCLYVTATGRRVITTRNAFMAMPSPLADPGAVGVWSDFVRVYTPDLTSLRYSSILTGTWDWQTGSGGSEVKLAAVVPVAGGLLVVGYAPAGKDGKTAGAEMPARNVPAWGEARRSGEMGVAALLRMEGGK